MIDFYFLFFAKECSEQTQCLCKKKEKVFLLHVYQNKFEFKSNRWKNPPNDIVLGSNKCSLECLYCKSRTIWRVLYRVLLRPIHTKTNSNPLVAHFQRRVGWFLIQRHFASFGAFPQKVYWCSCVPTTKGKSGKI